MATTHSRQNILARPTPATICWELAVKIFNTELTRDPKKLIYVNKRSSAYPSCSFSDVRAAATACAAGQDLRCRSVFRDRMEVFISTASRYCVAIDVMVEHSPEITALVWGSIRCLILIAVTYFEVSEQIGDAVVYITQQIGRWETYLQLYPTSSRVHNAIARLYAQIINFSVRAAKLQRKGGSGLVRFVQFACTGHALQIKMHGILAKMEKLSAAIEHETKLASLEEQSAFRSESRHYQTRVVTSESVRRALEWLEAAKAPPAPPVEWAQGTCTWIFEHEAYVKWVRSRYTGSLWIHGIPGCGKSVIASFLAQEPKNQLVFTHTYALSSDQGRAPKLALAASVLARILKSNANTQTNLHERLLPLLDQYGSSITCPFHKLWPCLKEALETVPHEFTLIVDALDECADAAHVRELLEKLESISCQLPNARVILISRYRDDYEKRLVNSTHLDMDQNAVSSDITHFVENEIDCNPKLESLREEILSTVKTKAQGMFLWASMLMECLKQAATNNTQRERLGRFPAGLGALYNQLLLETGGRLRSQELSLRRHIFMLLIAAERPLSADEISTAIALRSTAPPSTGDMLLEPTATTIMQLCWPLVTISVEDRRMRLVHNSLREFLLSEPQSENTSLRIALEDAHGKLARVCLNQLGQSSLISTRLVENLLRQNALNESLLMQVPALPSLYEYASLHWHTHLAVSSVDQDLANQVGKFLSDIPFIAWAEVYFRLTEGCYFGSVLSVRAALLDWCALGQPEIRDCIQADTFLIRAYESALNSPEFRSRDNIVHYLLLHRLGLYFNLRAEEHERRYQILGTVMEGTGAILGPSHPFALRSKAEFGLEKINRGEFKEAEELLWPVREAQRQNGDEEDQYNTLWMYAVALYLQLRLEESISFQQEASEGLLRTLGAKDKKYLRSQLYLAWALEAKGQLDGAMAIYDSIWTVWVPMYSRDEGLAMFAQMGMATVQGKKGNLNEAIRHGAEVFQNRRRVLGDTNLVTADATLNLAILYIGDGKYTQAHEHLSLVPTHDETAKPGTAVESFDRMWCHRIYLTKYLQASLHILHGETDRGISALCQLLYDAGEEDRRSSRELLRARLLLADCLRSEARPADEALECFAGLVSPLESSSIPTKYGEPNGASYKSFILEIAEEATRKIMNNDVAGAHELLAVNNLRWKRNEDYWMLVAGPFAEMT